MHEPMAWIAPSAVVLLYVVWAVAQARRERPAGTPNGS